MVPDGGEIKVLLSKRDKAVILKMNDYGIQRLTFEEINILHEIVSILKSKI